jgi:3-deoxy-7-phosphoheptulonate synthase
VTAATESYLAAPPAPPVSWPAWADLPALQTPGWAQGPSLDRVRARLATRPPLVDAEQIDTLRLLLAGAAEGRTHIIQAGDCAEDPFECTPEHISRKVGLLDALAGVMRMRSMRPVLRVGRMAGQFAKPRSSAVEVVGDVEIASYRGSMINGPEPDPHNRRPNPLRMLLCHRAATNAMEYLNGDSARHGPKGHPAPLVWTSHEALVLDYEVPQLRRLPDGRQMLTSTHWPWIGERTRRTDGAHVALLAAVDNPVACKVGPGMARSELLELCERLDPERSPGRLTLISRMGAEKVEEKLPALVETVRRAGHPVIWLCDPMHGNTVTTPGSYKTRLLGTVLREVHGFLRAVVENGGVAGGLHLETTPDQVTECVGSPDEFGTVGRCYTTLCDPRLNPQQAMAVAESWASAAEWHRPVQDEGGDREQRAA